MNFQLLRVAAPFIFFHIIPQIYTLPYFRVTIRTQAFSFTTDT
jgi:hypothetical protein